MGKRDLPDNLYATLNKYTGVTYYQYRDIRTGKYTGFGTDKAEAIADATALNHAITSLLAGERTKNVLNHKHQVTPTSSITMADWVVRYQDILKAKLKDGAISTNTERSQRCIANAVANLSGSIPLRDYTTKDVVHTVIKHYTAQGKNRMAQAARATLKDIFIEAIAEGECEHNPVVASKNPTARIKRARLTLEEFLIIMEQADKMVKAGDLQPWAPNSFRNALVMAQRLEDNCKMLFTDSDGEYLHVIQGKYKRASGTPSRIEIPLGLRLDAIDTTVGQAIAHCRDGVLSRYMLHHVKGGGTYNRGMAVHPHTVSHAFTKVRDATHLTWPEGTNPPTAHELRSLAKRLYKKQGGVDTKVLLGHKTDRMGEVYEDDRGREWQRVEIRS